MLKLGAGAAAVSVLAGAVFLFPFRSQQSETAQAPQATSSSPTIERSDGTSRSTTRSSLPVGKPLNPLAPQTSAGSTSNTPLTVPGTNNPTTSDPDDEHPTRNPLNKHPVDDRTDAADDNDPDDDNDRTDHHHPDHADHHADHAGPDHPVTQYADAHKHRRTVGHAQHHAGCRLQQLRRGPGRREGAAAPRRPRLHPGAGQQRGRNRL